MAELFILVTPFFLLGYWIGSSLRTEEPTKVLPIEKQRRAKSKSAVREPSQSSKGKK